MEYVVLVDSQNHIMGLEEKLLAHTKGSLHRAVSVCLFDDQGRWLLQKRASCKYHSPNQWANSCCSHPRLNEDPQEAAQRRLFEELGMTVPLTFCGTFVYKEQVACTSSRTVFDPLHMNVSPGKVQNAVVTPVQAHSPAENRNQWVEERAKMSPSLVEYEYDFLFSGKVGTQIPCLNKEEVSEVAFFSEDEIVVLLREKPAFFAPWFSHVFYEVVRVYTQTD